MDIWRAADSAGSTNADPDGDGGGTVVVLEDGERTVLRRAASAGLQLMANLTAGYPEGAARVFEVRVCVWCLLGGGVLM